MLIEILITWYKDIKRIVSYILFLSLCLQPLSLHAMHKIIEREYGDTLDAQKKVEWRRECANTLGMHKAIEWECEQKIDTTKFGYLPDDMLRYHIFSYLTIKDLALVRATNKKYKKWADESICYLDIDAYTGDNFRKNYIKNDAISEFVNCLEEKFLHQETISLITKYKNFFELTKAPLKNVIFSLFDKELKRHIQDAKEFDFHKNTGCIFVGLIFLNVILPICLNQKPVFFPIGTLLYRYFDSSELVMMLSLAVNLIAVVFGYFSCIFVMGRKKNSILRTLYQSRRNRLQRAVYGEQELQNKKHQ